MRSLGENIGGPTAFGPYLREQREAQGLTLRKFAELVQVAPSYVSNLESAEMPAPSEKIVRRMAQVLGLREGALLARAGKLTPETWRWFWAQPGAQAILACASGMTERDARIYVQVAFPELGGYRGESH